MKMRVSIKITKKTMFLLLDTNNKYLDLLLEIFAVNVFHGNQCLQIGVQYTRSKNI